LPTLIWRTFLASRFTDGGSGMVFATITSSMAHSCSQL